MKTACVECRWKQDVSATLDDVANGLKKLGYLVSRWTHDHIQGAYGKILPSPADVVVTWYGLHPVQNSQIHLIRKYGSKLLFMEYGWWDRGEAFQIDPCGTNGLASWAQWPETWDGDTSAYNIKTGGHLLVCLQGECDGHSKRINPWFNSNASFIKFLCQNSDMPIKVRPHPFTAFGMDTKMEVLNNGAMLDDPRVAVETSIQECSAVATLSSACGVTAMEMGKPVLVYGKAAYRYPGAVFCMDNNPIKTKTITSILKQGVCNLSQSRMDFILTELRKHLLYRKDLPDCLIPYL